LKLKWLEGSESNYETRWWIWKNSSSCDCAIFGILNSIMPLEDGFNVEREAFVGSFSLSKWK